MKVTKQEILAEIRRTAEENGGEPLGIARFRQETGIARSDWYGKHWARWGDALIEAGFEPNELQQAIPDSVVLDKLITLIQRLGRFPTTGDLRLAAKENEGFPSHNVFRRLGRKRKLGQLVIQRCGEREGLDEVIALCEPVASRPPRNQKKTPEDQGSIGYVYLIRSGKYYKIGKSNSVGRREYELGVQMPEGVNTEHVIRTDDPRGIEAYWHRRFADRRKGGEWFDLGPDEVRAFKRRKFM